MLFRSNYLALWTLQSPEAFKTAEYTSDWGFFEWAPYVTDWSRDLFDGRFAPEAAFAVAPEGSLHTMSFDGMSEDEADAARAVIAGSEPEMMWLPVAGLDRHTAVIGLKPLSDLSLSLSSNYGQGKQIQEAIYRPISELYRVSAAADAGCRHVG